MAFDLSGKVKLIQKPQTFASGFSKREIVVTVEDGKYPQDICLEFLQDKMALLDKVAEGQKVKISFDIRGREYNGRYFNNLVGWRIETDGAAAPSGEESAPFPDEADAPGEVEEESPF